nr:hypothetical protein [Croceibacterium xixiisoli]
MPMPTLVSRSAMRQRHRAPFFQHLHHDGGGGQHEAGAGNKALRHRIAQRQADTDQQRNRQPDLRRAQPENLPPHGPEPRRLHFQPDDEQEHHHAQFGDMQDRFRIGEKAQAERPDRQPRRQIAEHRTQPDPLEQRHRDHGGQQQDHDRGDIEAMRPLRRMGGMIRDLCHRTVRSACCHGHSCGSESSPAP